MSIFDTLAENRYQQWLDQRTKSDYKPPAPPLDSAGRTSYEARIYREALCLLEKAALLLENEGETHRAQVEDLLGQADELHFQLTILLEKKNLALVAGLLTDSIEQHRSELGLPVSALSRTPL